MVQNNIWHSNGCVAKRKCVKNLAPCQTPCGVVGAAILSNKRIMSEEHTLRINSV